jgi:AcrR family transcriptional regulator
VSAKHATALRAAAKPRRSAELPADQSLSRAARWTQDPEGVRRNILEVAHREFVEKGLSGARIDEIAARTTTSKRMIYYYFGDKQGLYIAVLEQAYSAMREGETALDLTNLPPRAALEKLAAYTFDYHAQHADFVRLVMVENIHHARHLALSKTIASLNLSAVTTMRGVYERGVAEGLFRKGLDPLQLHLTLSAMCFYNVSNRASIRQIFSYDMGAAENLATRRHFAVDALVRLVCITP